jgi:hypothetical protein
MTRTREVYGIYHHDRGWLKDSCGEGAWTGFDTFEEGQADAKTWTSHEELGLELDACELELGVIGRHFEIVPLEQPAATERPR